MENILIIGGGNLCLEVITYLKDITVFSKRKFNLIGVVETRKIDKKSIEDIFGKKIKQYSNLKSINFKNNNYRSFVEQFCKVYRKEIVVLFGQNIYCV